jgi:hypothetical protein
LALLLHGLDVSLLLEHLGVLCHVLGRGERIKVADVRVAIEDGNEWRRNLSQRAEWQRGEEWQRLDIGQGRDSVLGVSDQSVGESPVSVCARSDQGSPTS